MINKKFIKLPKEKRNIRLLYKSKYSVDPKPPLLLLFPVLESCPSIPNQKPKQSNSSACKNMSVVNKKIDSLKRIIGKKFPKNNRVVDLLAGKNIQTSPTM